MKNRSSGISPYKYFQKAIIISVFIFFIYLLYKNITNLNIQPEKIYYIMISCFLIFHLQLLNHTTGNNFNNFITSGESLAGLLLISLVTICIKNYYLIFAITLLFLFIFNLYSHKLYLVKTKSKNLFGFLINLSVILILLFLKFNKIISPEKIINLLTGSSGPNSILAIPGNFPVFVFSISLCLSLMQIYYLRYQAFFKIFNPQHLMRNQNYVLFFFLLYKLLLIISIISLTGIVVPPLLQINSKKLSNLFKHLIILMLYGQIVIALSTSTASYYIVPVSVIIALSLNLYSNKRNRFFYAFSK